MIMLKPRLLIAVATALLAFSCRNGTENSETIMNEIDLDAITEIALSDLVTDVSIIPLQLTEESALTPIAKVHMEDDEIVVLNGSHGEVMIFDTEGRFKERVANPGPGPATFERLADFTCNSKTQEIHLLSPTGRIITYHRASGAFTISLALPEELRPIYGFHPLGDREILVYSDLLPYAVYRISADNATLLSSHLENTLPDEISFNAAHPFTTVNGNTMFLDIYSGTVYAIDKGEVVEHRRFDFGKYQVDIDEDFLRDLALRGDLSALLQDRNAVYPLASYLEDERLILLRALVAGDQQREFIYSFTDQIWRMLDLQNLGIMMLDLGKASDGRYIGAVNWPGTMKENFKDVAFSSRNDELKLDYLREGSNPVLFLYRSKL